MFCLICAWTNGCANNRDAGDLTRHRAHHDVTVIIPVSAGSIKMNMFVYFRWIHCWIFFVKISRYCLYLRFDQKKSSEFNALWLHDGILVNSLECVCKYGSVHIDKPLDTPRYNKLGTSRQIDCISLLGRRPPFIAKLDLGFHYIWHWGSNKMAAILQTTFSNAVPWINVA